MHAINSSKGDSSTLRALACQEFYQVIREESNWIEQFLGTAERAMRTVAAVPEALCPKLRREPSKHDPRLCGFAIGDRVRLKCRLFSETCQIKGPGLRIEDHRNVRGLGEATGNREFTSQALALHRPWPWLTGCCKPATDLPN